MTLAVRQENPPAGPLDVPELVQPLNPLEIGIGAYTDIVAIYGPAEVEAGQTVNIQVAVKNLHTTGIYIACVGRYNGNDFAFSPEYATVYWGQTYTFTYSFPMLSKDVRIDVWSFYWAESEWWKDDDEYVIIKLKTVVGWQPLDSVTVRVDVSAPPVVGWQPLDSATVRVDVGAPPVVGWQPLDSATVRVNVGAPPVTGWQPLATITIGVNVGAPPVTGWQALATTTVGVTAGPPVARWELIDETIYPWAYFYDGLAAIWEFEFTMSPEEFPWTEPIARKVVDELASRLEAEGSKLLELRIYLDRAGPLWSRWRGEVTVADLEQEEIGSIAIAPALVAAMPWIIKGAVIAAVALVIYFTIIRPLTEKDVIRYKLSEKIKLEWQVEDPEIIPRMITALRPDQYPPETLEGVSDQELLDILDDVYEEEAEEEAKGWPWYIWATIAGVGIAGSFVAVKAIEAFAPKKGAAKEKEE